MNAGTIPRVDFTALPHEMLRHLAQDFNNEEFGRLMDEDDLDDGAYRKALIEIIQDNAPSTALH